MINPDNYDAVIFDLGGVLLNIDYRKTAEAFNLISEIDFEEAYSKASQTELFDFFEIGHFNAEEFRTELRILLGLDIEDSKIDEAWNAMLLDFPKERLSMLRRLKNEKQTFILSNTNCIHQIAFEDKLFKNYGLTGLTPLCEEVYYSHELGMRKPHAEIFDYVISAQNLNPTRTLFIDDTERHVLGAKNVGLHTFHLDNSLEVTDIFSASRY